MNHPSRASRVPAGHPAWGAGHVGQIGNGQRRTVMIAVPVATGATSISSTANNVVINVPASTRHRQA